MERDIEREIKLKWVISLIIFTIFSRTIAHIHEVQARLKTFTIQAHCSSFSADCSIACPVCLQPNQKDIPQEL